MTSRLYDYILTVANAQPFLGTNVVIGVNTQTTATIANVNIVNNTIKVKLDNAIQEFESGESLISNNIITTKTNVFVSYSNVSSVSVDSNSYIINGTANTFALPSSLSTINFTKDAIRVYSSGNVVANVVYDYPSTVLGNRGIDFKPLVHIASTGIPSRDDVKSKITNFFGNTAEDYSTGTVLNTLLNYDADNVTLTANTETSDSVYVLPSANTSDLTIQVLTGNLQYSTGLFSAAAFNSHVEVANSTISSIAYSTYSKEKNAFEQRPLVRLYTIYYPGEWYPANSNDNPTLDGAGHSWPDGFPYRFAEIRGDYISDINYRVKFDGKNYQPYPMESGSIGLDSTGKINDISISISNYDNLITQLVESPYLVGNNSSNATTATVNGELVSNIDPRTVPGNALYDVDVVSARGGMNLAFDYASTQVVGGTWTPAKIDTRDLLGGVVEIKTTYANFLDVWPEYSTIRSKFSNTVEVYSSLPYRVGDNVRPNSTSVESTIVNMAGNFITLNELQDDVIIGEPLYIVNDEADSDNYHVETFKINNLESLDDKVATFTLVSWLQYFKLQLPKRKFFKNVCPWSYKGAECAYPTNGSGSIIGSSKTANGFFDINNNTVFTAAQDVCAKNFEACSLRHNEIRYGGFPGTGRTIPR